MNSNVTLTNSSQFYLANAEVFLRSIPTQIKFGELSDDALRLLVYYISKAGPFELAVESGYFTGTLEEWLSSLKSNLQFKAVVDEYSDLATFEGASQGDLVFVKSTNMAYIYDGGAFAEEVKGISITGPSAYDSAVTNGFQGTVQDFLDSLKGEDGDDGLPGVNGSHGLSAYEIAQEAGFTGTEAEWLASLVGTPGQDGIDGDQGVPGINGRSAYELAVESGFEGNLEDWLASLHGASAYTLAVNNGFNGTLTQWIASLKGERGFSPYELYVQSFVDPADALSESAWLLSLKGEKGDKGDVGETGLTGKSAYQSYVSIETGKILSETAWLAQQADPALVEEGDYEAYVALQTQAILSEVAWVASLKAPAALSTVVGEVDTTSATPITETDTLLQIIGKLQAQISDLETRLATVESV